MGESENARSGLFGLTLRQAVVLAVIAYSLIIGLFIVRNFANSVDSEPITKTKLVTKISGEKSNALSTEEDALESVADAELEDDVLDELRNTLYHSKVVFGLNYEDMLSKFKIFIYPGDEHSFKALSGAPPAEELRNTDEYFFHQLYQSDFVTLDPEKAHLLLVPISIRSLLSDPLTGHPDRLGKLLTNYVQELRDDFPFWDRALGADHLLVTCSGINAGGSRNILELTKNVIQVACSPLDGTQAFYPHKDVAIPVVQNSTLTAPSAEREGERSTLAYYHGETDPSSFYASLGVSWETDSLFSFESRDVEPAVQQKRLSTSKFCLILEPKDYPDIVNALRFGCVPVIVSDGKLYDLPFQDILNWNQFSIILSKKNVKSARSLLQDVDEKQYDSMQYLAKEASRHLEWHDPPVEQDAFYMVLYDLWVRRHAIRYVRRDEL